MLIAIILAQLAQVLCWALAAVVCLGVVGVALELSTHLEAGLRDVLLSFLEFRRDVVLDIGAVANKISARKHLV